jgi:hypothetical protein
VNACGHKHIERHHGVLQVVCTQQNVDKDDFRKVASILRPADLTGSMSRMWISTIWLEELANAWPCGGRCLDTLRGVGDPKSETGHYITPSPRRSEMIDIVILAKATLPSGLVLISSRYPIFLSLLLFVSAYRSLSGTSPLTSFPPFHVPNPYKRDMYFPSSQSLPQAERVISLTLSNRNHSLSV